MVAGERGAQVGEGWAAHSPLTRRVMSGSPRGPSSGGAVPRRARVRAATPGSGTTRLDSTRLDEGALYGRAEPVRDVERPGAISSQARAKRSGSGPALRPALRKK